MARKPRIPSYRHHKPTNQAVVTLGGRDYYLGIHDSPESHEEYRRLIAEWMGSGCVVPAPLASGLTVDEVFDRYWTFAEGYYQPGDGDCAGQAQRIRSALGHARRLYGTTDAARFGPAALRATRQSMIAAKYSRKFINQLIGCVRRAFKWAASHELIPASVPHALATVEGLRAGRTEARESEPIDPVPEADIEPVRQRVLPTVRDLIDLQLLTATRPGEILRLKDTDIDRSGPVWIVRKAKHKNAWRGQSRTIYIGPKGQEIIMRRLNGQRSGPYLFSAIDAAEARYRELGMIKCLAKRQKRRPGQFYRGQSYCRAIARACERAGVTPWHPHQLRHNAATRLVAEFGWDTARIILGQQSLDATRIYATDDVAKAIEAMKKVG